MAVSGVGGTGRTEVLGATATVGGAGETGGGEGARVRARVVLAVSVDVTCHAPLRRSRIKSSAPFCQFCDSCCHFCHVSPRRAII